MIRDSMPVEDLRVLAAESGHPRVVDPAVLYRDAEPHAVVVRARELVQRTAQIVTVMRGAGTIFARRLARAAAGIVVALYGLGLMLHVRDVEPGVRNVPEPDVYAVATLILAAVAYATARLIGGRVFARRLAGSAEPLADRARQLVDRVDGWAIAATIAGFATILPMLAFSVIAEDFYQQSRWDTTQLAATYLPLDVIAACIAGAIVLGVVVARAVAHADAFTVWVRRVGSIVTLTLALAVGLVAFHAVGGMVSEGWFRDIEGSSAPHYAVAIVAASALAGASLALMLRGRELARLPR